MRVSRRILAVALAMGLSCGAWAHLCNDVFVQAKDNLAVKVDIRDGQLRIGKEASFNVYLLNTMDRDIVDIRLEVQSPQFESRVTPDSSWQGFPLLKSSARGVKKQSFQVTLTRKPNVPDGKYAIKLRLFNGQNRTMEFKTVDLGAAADVFELPRVAPIALDGKGDSAEWAKALLCQDFHAYAKTGQYFTNSPARNGTRVRMAADESNLYLLFSLQGGAKASSDVLRIYMAPTTREKPVVIGFDRVTRQAAGAPSGVEFKVGEEGATVECKIPRAALGLGDANAFHANFTRAVQTPGAQPETSYWRGNKFSESDPIIYGVFRMTE